MAIEWNLSQLVWIVPRSQVTGAPGAPSHLVEASRGRFFLSPGGLCHGAPVCCQSSGPLLSLALALALAAGSGCGDPTPEGPDAAPPPPICEGAYGSIEDRGALQDAELLEASGLATSLQSPGVLWSHNDSGDSARLFMVRDDGAALGRLALPGVTAEDFEDMDLGPCPDGTDPCLWVADTGNNLMSRTEVVVYATPEPSIDPSQESVELTADTVWRFPIDYPGDPIDIEAMMVAADGPTLYFFEKNNLDRARIYRHPGPLVADQLATLEELGDFAAPGLAVDFGRAITAADLHPSGTRMLLRVYTAIYEYRFGSGQGVADLDAIEPTLVAAGPLTEPQGEALTYDFSGSGVWSVSEDAPDTPRQQLHHFSCEP